MSNTYLQLTNAAIQESGVDLDPLTSADFATTTDPLKKLFKRWTNQSLREIELERNEWEYKTKQAQVVIWPRFLVIDGDREAEPPAASEYEGDDSGATFEVIDVTTLTGDWVAGTATAYIDFVNLSTQPAFNELFDEIAPDNFTDVFRLKWFGRYDFQSTVSGLQEINKSSFKIQQASGLASPNTDYNTGSSANLPLQFVPWDLFNVVMETTPAFAQPAVVTETPEGTYDFFPRPNGPYVLSFQYLSSPQELTVYSDTVTDMPLLYQDMIVWRTVMYYADYDRKPDQFARAERRYRYYKNRAEKNLMPTPTFGFNRYDFGY